MSRLRVLALAGALALSAASTLNPDPPPEPDRCDEPVTSGAGSLEIGAPGEASFRALGDDEIADIEAGTQGADMLMVRYRVSGIEAGCVTQRTRIARASDGELIGQSEVPLRVYPEGEALATREHFVVLDRVLAAGEGIVVSAELAGATDEVRLWVEEVPVGDAGVDAKTR